MPMPDPSPLRESVTRIFSVLDTAMPNRLFESPALLRDLHAVADAIPVIDDPLLNQEMVDFLREVRDSGPLPTAFAAAPAADVFVPPGIMGTELRDLNNRSELIWIPLSVTRHPDLLRRIRLQPFVEGQIEQDATPGLNVQPSDAVPVVYARLRWN